MSDSSDPMDCSPPGSSIHGIFQARVLEWGAIAFSRVPLPSTLLAAFKYTIQYYLLQSPCCALRSLTYLNWKFVPFAPFTHFARSPTSGNHQAISYIFEFKGVFICLLVLDFTYKFDHKYFSALFWKYL